MNTYSSVWQSTSGSYSQFDAQSARQCRCARHCRCRPGGACRCGGGCSCKSSQAPRPPTLTDLWTESGEQELRRPPSFRSGGRMPHAARRQWLRSRAQGLFQRAQFVQRQWQRRGRLNRYFARRFGWGRHMRRLTGVVGCPSCTPGSQLFARALSRWQRRNGLRPTGVLTPSLWWRLRAQLLPSAGTFGGQSPVAMPALQPEPAPADTASTYAAEPAPAEPDDGAIGAPADDAADAPPEAGAQGEFGVGFRARRLQPGTPAYERARRPYGLAPRFT